MIDWENYSPSIIKPRVESSNLKPPPDKTGVQPAERRSIAERVESSDEKPPTDEPDDSARRAT